MLKSVLEGFGWTLGAMICLGVAYLVVHLPRRALEILIVLGMLTMIIYFFLRSF
jgi:uncharacterized membrane protein YfcA